MKRIPNNYSRKLHFRCCLPNVQPMTHEDQTTEDWIHSNQYNESYMTNESLSDYERIGQFTAICAE